jgi:hypothetical protein
LDATKIILGYLHEMLLGLFFTYEFTCSTKCLEITDLNYGKWGYYVDGWLRAAHALEKSCEGEGCAKLFNIKLDFARLTTVAYYEIKKGIPLPEEP